jgi:upstream activation factor subunit UAF30
MATLESIESAIKSLHREMRKIHQILADPSGEKAKKRTENNSFKRPLKVSDHLRDFLHLQPDEMISRSEVTKRINLYAAENNLKNGQKINMDDKLRALLNPPEGTDITYLNIQRYMKDHYIKDEPNSTEVSKSPVVEVPQTPKKSGRPAVKK